MADLVSWIVMLAAVLLTAGAVVMWRRTGEAKQPALMIILALVAIINVLIWTLPIPAGETPLEQAQQLDQEN